MTERERLDAEMRASAINQRESPDEVSGEAVSSRFDDFGGYYSVRFDGIEYARFAPSTIWSKYAEMMEGHQGWSYAFVSTDDGARP